MRSALVPERHAIEFNRAGERRSRTRIRKITDRALDADHFLDAFEAHRRFRHRARHLRQIFDWLVGLFQVHQEDDQHAGGQLAGGDELHSVREHQTRSDRHDDVDHRRQLGLDAAGLQSGAHVLAAFRGEAAVFVILAGVRLHDLNRREHFSDVGKQLAFLLLDRSRGLLDLSRVEEDEDEEHRRDRKADQGEPPVDVEHDRHHADQGQQVDDNADQRGVDEVLNRVDVFRDPGDEVAAP